MRRCENQTALERQPTISHASVLSLCALLICCLSISRPLTAQTTANSDAQREAFLAAEKLAKTGKLSVDNSLYRELADYPLMPYVEYNRILALPGGVSETEFERFESRYSDLHLVRLLRTRLMDRLIDEGNWQGYAKHYLGVDSPSAEQQCLYARSLFRAGNRTEAYALGRNLWVVGESQPKACDPLFKAMRSDGQIDSEMGLTRMLNALDQNRSGLAGYAKRFITDKSLKPIAEDAMTIYQSPEKVVGLSRGLKGDLQSRLQHIAVQRAYRGGYERALKLLLDLGEQYNLSGENSQLLGKVGVRVAKELRSSDRVRLAQLDPNFASSDLTEWRIRLALMDKDWSEIKYLISKLPVDIKNENRWLYWREVANSRTGVTPDFTPILNERSFYGFIAAQLEQQPYDLNHQSPQIDEGLLAELRNSDPMARIKELVALDRYTVARSEWNSWIENLDRRQRQGAARLMAELGWYQMGILAAAYEGFWDDMELRFPMAFPDLFEHESTQRNIDPLWALAVSRQESALFPWARSPVGARGLMQLMPNTAKRTSKVEKIPYRGAHELYEPHTNIRLGTAYLAQMFNQFKGNRAHATAAYNAGPQRVKGWLAGREGLPLDIWIELIPFDETRTYVQNVLAFRVIYAELHGEPRRLFSDGELKTLVLAQR